MSGYVGLESYEKPLRFVDMTVAEVDRLLQEKGTFVFLTSYAECPWCNAVISYISDAAAEAEMQVGYIDTRKDPSWTNNTEIEDYDLFVEDFGAYLEEDEEGKPHLYVPHIFFVRQGKVVYQYQGALPEMEEDPQMQLTEEQKEALTNLYREGFRKLR